MFEYNKRMELDCNNWIRGGYDPILIQARQKLAKYVNANVEDLVMIENASSGFNAIMRSLTDLLPLGKDDSMLFMNIAYPMVKNVADYLSSVKGFELIIANITYPIVSEDDFIKPVIEAIESNRGKIKVASFDHISSYPASILPIKKLIDVCQQNGIIVIVDGAHALGQLQLDINSLNPDFYFANAHKWMYSPKGTSMLWVNKKWHKLIHPAVISSEAYITGVDWIKMFQYTGTRDYSAFLSIIDAMEFRASLGEEAILRYNHDLAWNAALKISSLWKTRILTPESMVGFLVCVELPCDMNTANIIAGKLNTEYNIYVQLSKIGDIPYIRFSGQIYLEESDFINMADLFLKLLEQEKERLL